MSEPKISASARVTVQVEINVSSGWGAGCTIEQVHKQAADEARGKMQNMILQAKEYGRVRVIGEPKITAVLVEREGP